MKKLLAAVAIVGLAAGSAYAAEFADVDTDQSGAVSMEEAQAAMADMTEDQFKAADTDQSGDLSAEEFAALGG